MSFFDQFLTPPPPDPAPRRATRPPWAKPENVLPAVVAADLMLARTPDLAVAIRALTVYPTGFEFTALTLQRSPDPGQLGMPMHHWSGPHAGRVPDEFLRLAVVFADGRVATNIDPGHGPPVAAMQGRRAVMMPGGGGGGPRVYEMNHWIYPLPPPGPLTFVCEWPAFGVPETRLEYAADSILDAVARIVELWPDGPDETATTSHVATITGSSD